MKKYANIPSNVIGGEGVPGMTLRDLIERYKSDPISGWSQLRYGTRKNHESLLGRMVQSYGAVKMSEIRLRTIEEWYLAWSENKTKKAIGHAFISKLRTLCHYGAGLLEDGECARICIILGTRRYETSKPRQDFLTAEHAIAIRRVAHEIGYASIALAQALQFEIVLRQKDVIGEWVPLEEPGESDVTWRGMKWLRGIRWTEIDSDLVLRHLTSKVGKPLIVDLSMAPMVVEELARWPAYMRSPTGPLIICEATARPWIATEFRRKWRVIADIAGVPKNVFNMDSRSGGITEGTDAGLTLEQMRHAATHSSVTMTARYSRNAADKIAESLKARVAHRNQRADPQ